MDIFKRPFSRKSMTPPASPGSQSKSNQLIKEDIPASIEESTVLTSIPHETSIIPEAEDSVLPLPSVPVPAVENGQTPEIFPLPLPPTPNASPIAVSLHEIA